MESLSPQVFSAAKLPILNPNEFDLRKMRIEQYFLMTDYSLWEVILNGDSPIPTRVVDDKHQLKFNIHKDAKSLMEAIEKRFSGNKETKKVHKTLLKQQYENFTGSSSESLDQIHDKLQKRISQLEILGESLSQEDINMKFLRSLPTDVKTASTPIETKKPLVKDTEAVDVDVHLYRSMIGSLMYLTASRPNIMYAVCACSRESAFDLEAYLDSDYARANLDRKFTTGGCQFLGRKLISWQCKKQKIVATSTIEAEYVAATSCLNGLIGVQGNGNQNQIGNGNLVATVGHYARNCTVRPRRKDVTYLQTQLLINQKEEAGI
nr:putative ribonuclease H-like domain-containing protein [Tanacetum cinerariifolium]